MRKKSLCKAPPLLQYTLLLLLLISSWAAHAQTRKISGKVTASGTNTLLSGVTVQVKGGKSATVTNDAGEFSLTIDAKVRTLSISFVGYQSEEVSVGSSDFITTSLQLNSNSLSDVVVVGYGSLKR